MTNDWAVSVPHRAMSPVTEQTPRRPSNRGRWTLLAVGALAAATIAVLAYAHARAGSGASTAPDLRPIILPATILGEPLRSDPSEVVFEEQMQPILAEIFGSRPAAVARYSTTHILNLIAGRGPVAGRPAGDVRTASANHQRFGDITCGNMVYNKVVLTTVNVCWYSTRTFGASVVSADDGSESMAQVAAALDAAVPGMRDS